MQAKKHHNKTIDEIPKNHRCITWVLCKSGGLANKTTIDRFDPLLITGATRQMIVISDLFIGQGQFMFKIIESISLLESPINIFIL